MFVLDNYSEIILHLKNISRIFKKESSGWYSMFCPFCDDAVRKANPRHGHFHVSPTYPFAHCFRCSTKIGLYELLTRTGFQNQEILEIIKKIGNFTYSHVKKIKSPKQMDNKKLLEKIKEEYNIFSNKYPKEFNIYTDYVYKRCLNINPIQFYMCPTIESNNVGVRFLNYDGNIVTIRLINSTMRYKITSIRYPYYFQDISKLFDYNDIVIVEGAFDAINLYYYYPLFNNAFFIAIGGNHYSKIATNIISNYLLIGKYNVHVVFDQNLKKLQSIIRSITTTSNQLNTEIQTYFHLPVLSKDVSECMFLKQINNTWR